MSAELIRLVADAAIKRQRLLDEARERYNPRLGAQLAALDRATSEAWDQIRRERCREQHGEPRTIGPMSPIASDA